MATKKYPKKPKKKSGTVSFGPPGKPLVVKFNTVKTAAVRLSGQPGPGNTKPYCTRLLQVAGTLLIEEGEVTAELQIVDIE